MDLIYENYMGRLYYHMEVGLINIFFLVPQRPISYCLEREIIVSIDAGDFYNKLNSLSHIIFEGDYVAYKE